MATRATQVLCGLAGNRHGLSALLATTSHENVASRGVLVKVGFVPVGLADPADLGRKQGTLYRRALCAG